MLVAICLFAAGLCANSQRTHASESVDYLTHIKPLLSEKCYSCHGRLKQNADLRLETRSLMLDAAVITPNNPNDSELLRRVMASDENERMPPPGQGSALKPDETELLRNWIAQGAVAPDEPVPASPLEHWAFQRIARPELPSSASRAENPIDAILNKNRTRMSVQVQLEAPRGILLRRLYLDLIGLPPTHEQLHDERSWEQIVDELLSSPQHGERWGRHWMDVWRYSDWYGLGAQLRYSQKHIWHWRDWIIESLNNDKGYDQLILEMLAADEVAPLDSDALRATGFLARNYYLFNRTTWLDSTIEHTAKAFLGLTVNCAKCHDHKYDPITQLDYYQMRAIFEPHQVRLDPVADVTDFEKDGIPRVFDDHTDAKTFVHLRGNPKTLDQETIVQPRVPEFLAAFQPQISPVPLPLEAFAPSMRDYVQRDRLQVESDAVEAARQAVANCTSDKERAVAEAQLALAEVKQSALVATFAADRSRYDDGIQSEPNPQLAKQAAILQSKVQVLSAQLQKQKAANDQKQLDAATEKLKQAEKQLSAAERGEFQYSSVRGAKKALESPAHKESDYPATYAAVSTGRRRALAEWITSKRNPLTARVAVNHVWMRHFGEPLVESVFDFGLRAPRPANLELLDYLAHEFMESGWSFRHLHRLIVTSRTYRLRSSTLNADETTLTADSNNQFYWRMNGRRMESQVVRDSILHLAGELDTTIGGPSVDVDRVSNRRSLYFKHSRDDQSKFLKMFDDADLFQCYRRNESIVPQQALALANSDLALSMAEKIAEQIVRQHATELQSGIPHRRFHNRITLTFETLLARKPTREELATSVQFFDELANLTDDADEQAMYARFVHALLNHNDFISIR